MDPLRGEKYLSLATFRNTGKVVATPVWFVEKGDKYYVFTLADSGKMKRLRNSSKARVAACNGRGDVHGEWIDATAKILSDTEAIKEAHRAIRRKYHILMWTADVLSTLAGRIRKRAWIEIEI